MFEFYENLELLHFCTGYEAFWFLCSAVNMAHPSETPIIPSAPPM